MLAYLWPGCGYGGSCLPKDVKALVAESERRGVGQAILTAADQTNERQARRLVERIEERLPLKGRKVALLGFAFKEGTSDPRSSPGLAIARELVARYAHVAAHDPLIESVDLPDVVFEASLDRALDAAAIWIVVTHASEFDDISSRAAAANVLLVDARRRYGDLPGGAIGPGLGPAQST